MSKLSKLIFRKSKKKWYRVSDRKTARCGDHSPLHEAERQNSSKRIGDNRVVRVEGVPHTESAMRNERLVVENIDSRRRAKRVGEERGRGKLLES